jgi:hypothetical protein
MFWAKLGFVPCLAGASLLATLRMSQPGRHLYSRPPSGAMRGLAPTRLALAGTAAGRLAGTIGAPVYCLHYPELGAPYPG